MLLVGRLRFERRLVLRNTRIGGDTGRARAPLFLCPIQASSRRLVRESRSPGGGTSHPTPQQLSQQLASSDRGGGQMLRWHDYAGRVSEGVPMLLPFAPTTNGRLTRSCRPPSIHLLSPTRVLLSTASLGCLLRGSQRRGSSHVVARAAA